MNLTAIRDRGDAVLRHVLDSLTVVPAWRDVTGTAGPTTLLDLGTGGGFPGAVLAAAWPRSRALLVDSTAKKLRCVEDALSAAGIRNASTLHARGTDILKLRPELRGAFDLCVARAVGESAELLRELRGLSTPQGLVVLMKGPEPPPEELSAAEREARRQGLAVLAVRRSDVPGLERRTILVYGRPRP